MKRIALTLSLCWLFISIHAQKSIDLSGRWQFHEGSEELPAQFDDAIQLPGSMLTNGKGDEISLQTPWMMQIDEHNPYYHGTFYAKYRQPGNIKVPFILQPEKYYVGPAWYQRIVEIPKAWKGQIIKLNLERAHWKTVVYVDGKNAGTNNRLCAPQEYDLSDCLTPGRHTLSILVDNRIHDVDPGENGHSISDNTQGLWNGIVGNISLKAYPRVCFDRIDVYPLLSAHTITVKMNVTNAGKKVKNADLQIGDQHFQQVLSPGNNHIEKTITMPEGVKYWDEFHPNLYKLSVAVSVKKERDERMINYGCREWGHQDGALTLNVHPVFMRGNVDCCTFPLTGYPSFDKSYWQRVFSVYKNYGLNHVRFHSWCPPDIAFEVADEMGIYCYVECSSWANQSTTLGDGKPIDDFIYQESEAIVKAYGNHPSFCMMSYGNEPGGENCTAYLRKFVTYWKSKDNRRIYTTAAGWPNIEESDWLSDSHPRIQLWGAGLKSIINSQEPSTRYDWSSYTSKFRQPMISHEIGQWCVYPRFEEIKKYTGAFKAHNFEIFQDRLRENHLLQYADSFLLASGKLQVLCYKADIEAALRTKNFGGFELLGLNDFPGQGTALTGVVDVFWDDKGYVTGKEYRRFCNSLVPLARMDKLVFNNDELFRASIEIADYQEPIHGAQVSWMVKDQAGKHLKSGKLDPKDIKIGNCQQIGNIEFPLDFVTTPQQLNLEVTINGRSNDWNFWVYPQHKVQARRDILITDTLDAQAIRVLHQGGKVLLSLGRGRVSKEYGGDVVVGFSSIFWNTLWTNHCPPHTLGILCDPNHPAFKEFPTTYHSDYQWQDAMSHSDAIRYDKISKDIRPIVRIIDDWFTARPLAMVFEVKVGKGSIIVSGADLMNDLEKRTSARQLRKSLIDYMSSTNFKPAVSVEIDTLQKLFLNIQNPTNKKD